MTLLYIPVKDETIGNAIAQALFSLTVPIHLQNELQKKMRNGTTIKHPEKEEYRLPVYNTLYPCHIEADEHCLDPFVQPFIDDGLIDVQVLVDMQQAMINAKGGVINTLGNLPEFWLQQGLDYDEMMNEGWFEVQE